LDTIEISVFFTAIASQNLLLPEDVSQLAVTVVAVNSAVPDEDDEVGAEEDEEGGDEGPQHEVFQPLDQRVGLVLVQPARQQVPAIWNTNAFNKYPGGIVLTRFALW
jgi:hypothetical protein